MSRYESIESVKMTYTIAVTLDDSEEFVLAFVGAIQAERSDYNILVLGSAEDIEVLSYRYKNTITLEKNDKSFILECLVILSRSALLELDTFVTEADKICLWFDPDKRPGDTDQILHSMFFDLIGQRCENGIAARTANGRQEWNGYGAKDTVFIPSYFKTLKKNVEPLIDKKLKPRILIDGRGEVTNTHLVESFILLSEIDVEIWCLFDGELKAWMRPDFHIKHIPADEKELYYSSVDGVLMCSENHAAERMAEIIPFGIMPVALFEKSINCCMNELVDYEAVSKIYFPNGVRQGVQKIFCTREELGEFNESALQYVKPEAYFSLNDISKRYVEGVNLVALFSDYQYLLFRQQYLVSRYGSIDGSDLHKKIALDNSIIYEISRKEVSLVEYSGWAIDVNDLSVCTPLPITDSRHKNINIQFYERQDVIDHFGLNTAVLTGFDARFISENEELQEEQVSYLVASENTKYGLVDVSGIDNIDSREVASKWVGEFGEYDPDLKCRVEYTKISKASSYSIEDYLKNMGEYVFRFRSGKEYLPVGSLEVECIINGKSAPDCLVHISDMAFSISTVDEDVVSSSVSVVFFIRGKYEHLAENVILVVSCVENVRGEIFRQSEFGACADVEYASKSMDAQPV